jgi:tetratricopeptide (TPR) repeat protein
VQDEEMLSCALLEGILMNQDRDAKFKQLLQAYHKAMQRGDIQEAEAIGVECLLLASDEAEDNPSADLQLKMEAHDHENAADWSQAEAAYRQALELAQTQKQDAMIYKAHADLSNLYSLLDQKDRALEESTGAVEAARRTDMVPLFGMALQSLIGDLLERGDVSSALSAATEMLDLCGEDRMYDLVRARALISRARCLVDLDDIASAEADLNQAWRILAPQASAGMFAGAQAGLAAWWAVTARLRSHQRDLPGAAEAWQKAVKFRRHVSQLPQLEGPYKFNALAQTLHRCGLALLAVSNMEAAAQAITESRTIRRSIGLPPCENSTA